MNTFILLDIDCFFASVEMALNPALRGKPLCVGGLRGARGIVSCPNYEARKYGVRTAMPLRTAARMLPPEAVFLRGNHKVYGEYSDRVMAILAGFTPDIEQVSVDEAYMDVTGCLHFWGHDPRRMAAAIQEQDPAGMRPQRLDRRCGEQDLCEDRGRRTTSPTDSSSFPPGRSGNSLHRSPWRRFPASARRRSRCSTPAASGRWERRWRTRNGSAAAGRSAAS